jgi:hypothetical protein
MAIRFKVAKSDNSRSLGGHQAATTNVLALKIFRIRGASSSTIAKNLMMGDSKNRS